MTFGNANISSDEVAWAAADMPLLIGRNWLRTPGASAKWNQAGTAAAADESDAAGPAVYGYDENDHLRTNPDAFAANWYYVIDLGSAIGVVDSVVLLNPGGFESEAVSVSFCTDQDGAFTPNQIAETQDPAGLKRLVFLNLDHDVTGTAQRYSEVRYLRIHFDAITTAKPYLGEVIIGRRRQLAHGPKAPYEDKRTISNVKRSISDTGVIKDYVFYTGARKLAPTLTVSQTARISDIDTFWETETEYGTLPWIWIDEPTTTPTDAYWMRFEMPEMTQPALGFIEREWSFSAIECGPNFISGGV